MTSKNNFKHLQATLFACMALICASNTSISAAQTDYSMVNARDTVHINSCGTCHLPYSPGLLPTPSWQLIMQGLNSHFGEQLTIEADSITHILNYLEKYALKPGQQTVMGQLSEDLPNSPSLRITQLPVFKNLHSNAIELMAVEEFEEIKLSQCDSCHRAAASHIFDKALLQIGHGDGPLSDYK